MITVEMDLFDVKAGMTYYKTNPDFFGKNLRPSIGYASSYDEVNVKVWVCYESWLSVNPYKKL